MSKKVLITGANGGFGRLAVNSLLANGHKVAAAMRGVNGKNAEAAKELEAAGASVVEIDVTSDSSVDQGVADAIEKLGGLDVIVNNAGVGVIGMQEHFTIEDWQKLFDVNVYGVQRVNRAALPHPVSYTHLDVYTRPGWFLYLTGNIQNRWNSEELEFKIQNIEHLSEIREKMTKGLELKMRLEDVNAIIVDEVERIAEKFPGKSLLKMSLVGVYENRAINLEMLSRKFTIDPTDELIKELQSIEELHFRVLLQKN